MKSGTRSIGIAELKAHCSEIVAKVQKTGIARVITVRGAPAVELRPIENVKARERVFGGLVGTVKILGDIVHADLEDVEYRDTSELFETRR
jgi:prevent-host-death family protein